MLSFEKIQRVLNDQRPEALEELARQAAQLTRQYFGRTISLYAPLYLSNYCSSHCTYCGFHSHHRIQRRKLSVEEMRQEMNALAITGIENLLLLTGESYQATPTAYLQEAVAVAKDYFTALSLEVHPMGTEEYRALFAAGVDGIAVYQETYDRVRYKEVHLSGKKADYDYRYGTPERAAQAGLRQISLGILLGLAQVAPDLHALYTHLRQLEKNYPGVDYSVSFPRLRTIKGRAFAVCGVEDTTLTKIICLTRVLFPRVGINLSTRESPRLRECLIELGVTRLSAGSNTAVGGYAVLDEEAQDPQFDIVDRRSVADIVAMLKDRNFDPVFTDWRPIENPIS